MRVARYDRLSDVAPAQWDSMWGQRRFYASSGWLRVAADTADLPPFYLVADDDQATYALPCYPIGASSPFPFCRVDRVLRRLPVTAGSDMREDLGASLLPSLLLGGRNPGHAGFGVAQARTVTDAAAAVDALLDCAERAAAERGLSSVAMLYVDDEDPIAREALAARGYLGFAHTSASLLTTPPGGVDGYLDTLSARDAGTVRREIRKLDAAGVRYDIAAPDDSVLAEVDALERNLNRKYAGTYDDDAVARLRRSMVRHLDGLFVARASMNGRTVGSLLAIRWRDELYARTVGFDYDATDGVPVYFGLLFYFLVDHAQRHGIRSLFYATGTEDAKRRRGCRLLRQYAYIKPLDAAVADHYRRLSI
jgi:hypothetical protein